MARFISAGMGLVVPDFQSKPGVCKSAGDFFAVFFCDALFAGDVAPFVFDNFFYCIDRVVGNARLKKNACGLRQQVCTQALDRLLDWVGWRLN